jgi:hypothetical protein
MRQTISGLAAAIAVMVASAVPAMACGYGSGCAPAYVPAPVYSGCNAGCGGWAHERLPDPEQQYYYVNQGPTYTGPGNFAPYPTYQESAVSGWGAYHHRPYYYGYDGGRYANATTHYYDGAGVEGPATYSYPVRRHFRPWRAHSGYRYHVRYAHRYSLPPRAFYAPHHSLRYGHMGAPHRYGYREHVLRRYY